MTSEHSDDTGMSVLHAISNELDAAALSGYKRIVHIRLTTDALPGSVTSTPITPERARTLGRLLALPGGGVVADPRSTELLMEILIHPEDWAALLAETDAPYTVQAAMKAGEPDRVYGIPVTRG